MKLSFADATARSTARTHARKLSHMLGGVLIIARFRTVSGIAHRAQLKDEDVHQKYVAQRTYSCLGLPKPCAAGGVRNGWECCSLPAASCPGLVDIHNLQKIIGGDLAASLDGDPLGNLARRPAAILAKLRYAASGNADPRSEIVALDRVLLEIFG